ncbi:MAG: hypothetical protein M5U33_04320 [Pseudorhodoplanes sp.]|nr:hypothetical protein [Pseudorhodoplanes sp.]
MRVMSANIVAASGPASLSSTLVAGRASSVKAIASILSWAARNSFSSDLVSAHRRLFSSREAFGHLVEARRRRVDFLPDRIAVRLALRIAGQQIAAQAGERRIDAGVELGRGQRDRYAQVGDAFDDAIHLADLVKRKTDCRGQDGADRRKAGDQPAANSKGNFWHCSSPDWPSQKIANGSRRGFGGASG